MRWFGESWGAPVCEADEHQPTPDVPCAGCDVPIQEGDQGVLLPFAGDPGDPPELAYHHGCLMWNLGLSHVHVLWEGLPLCRFQMGFPKDWPEGHKWTRLETWRVEATCSECRRTAYGMQRRAKERERTK